MFTTNSGLSPINAMGRLVRSITPGTVRNQNREKRFRPAKYAIRNRGSRNTACNFHANETPRQTSPHWGLSFKSSKTASSANSV